MPLIDILQRRFLSPWLWQVDAFSTSGNVRCDNEDAMATLASEHGSIVIVADGVGGRNAGEIAADTICQGLVQWFSSLPATGLPEIETLLDVAIRDLHQQLYLQSLQDDALKGMATTLVAAVQWHRKAVLAWVGDSRIYLFRRGLLQQLSEDHSLVQEHLKSGLIEPEDVANHPQANQITSSIGGQPHLKQLGMLTITLKKHDVLVLVSDGVSDVLDNSRIAKCVPAGAEALVQAALEAQSTDNCTAMLVTV